MMRAKIINWITQSLLGAVVGIMAAVGFLYFTALDRAGAPVNTIFTAAVRVPDFIPGEDPLVVYTRTIYQQFYGDFRVEVKGLDDVTVCSGGAAGILYAKQEQLFTKSATLSWYVGNSCTTSLVAGQYYLETNYTLHLPDTPNKYLTTVSNIFNVAVKE